MTEDEIEFIRAQLRLWKVGVDRAIVPDHVDALLAEIDRLGGVMTEQWDASLDVEAWLAVAEVASKDPASKWATAVRQACAEIDRMKSACADADRAADEQIDGLQEQIANLRDQWTSALEEADAENERLRRRVTAYEDSAKGQTLDLLRSDTEAWLAKENVSLIRANQNLHDRVDMLRGRRGDDLRAAFRAGVEWGAWQEGYGNPETPVPPNEDEYVDRVLGIRGFHGEEG